MALRCSSLPPILVAAALIGCGADPGPATWIRLAADFEPVPTVESHSATGGLSLRRSADGSSRVTATLDGAWTASEWPGVWLAPWPFGLPEVSGADAERLRLAWSGGEGRYAPPDSIPLESGALRPDRLSPGSFGVFWGTVFLVTSDAAAAPEGTALELRLDPGRSLNDHWRVSIGAHTAEALEVWPGERVAVERRLDGAGTLAFGTLVQPLWRADRPTEELVFRVRVDGRTLFESRIVSGTEGVRTDHRVELPERPRETPVELSFEVDGPPALTAFLEPRIVPSGIGSYGARPWADRGRDVVLVVADTLRADALTALGGSGTWAPELDALAARSVTFSNAWTTAPWTLPAHASLFSGLYPRQHGVVGEWAALSDRVESLAEVFAAAGYRTAAVTDSAYVSAHFGLDQGFQSFEAHEWFGVERTTDSLDDTLASVRARLDDDDGRPLFLFVHTYRVHSPYSVSPATREERAEALALGPDERSQQAEFEDLIRELGRAPRRPSSPAAIDLARRLYWGGVRDLDRGMAVLLTTLADRGLDRSALLAFTSDHGEAFDEHGVVGHSLGLWQEELAIPLLLRAAELTPGVDALPRSLVDLPVTLVQWAGLEAPSNWVGSSLLAEGGGEAALAWLSPKSGTDRVAVRGPRWKAVADFTDRRPRLDPLVHAYDLDRDPREVDDLAGREPGELIDRRDTWEILVERAATPVVQPRPAATVSAALAEQLEALGYTER